MEQATCKKCGSVYEIRRDKIIVRDRDSINCQVCGEELMRWNEAAHYYAKLIKEGKVEPDEKD